MLASWVPPGSIRRASPAMSPLASSSVIDTAAAIAVAATRAERAFPHEVRALEVQLASVSDHPNEQEDYLWGV